MVSIRLIRSSCHWVACVGAILAYWAVCAGATPAPSTRYGYDTATPHTATRQKYIPLHSSSYIRHETIEPNVPISPDPQPYTIGGMAPSEFILTALRTALDVVRNINKNRAVSSKSSILVTSRNSTAVALRRTKVKKKNTRSPGSGRGLDDYYDEHDHQETTTTTTAKPMKQGRYTDPWAGYYDWLINEGSFKFWSVFQVFTAALLLYACFSAIYYAKFNPVLPDYSMEYDDYFLERSAGRRTRSLGSWELPSGLSWMNSRTFQFILDAISKKYE